MADNNNKGAGMGVLSVLAIVFVVLKLTNNIDWSWWWVLAPVWVPFVIFIVLVVLITLGILVKGAMKKNGRN